MESPISYATINDAYNFVESKYTGISISDKIMIMFEHIINSQTNLNLDLGHLLSQVINQLKAEGKVPFGVPTADINMFRMINSRYSIKLMQSLFMRYIENNEDCLAINNDFIENNLSVSDESPRLKEALINYLSNKQKLIIAQINEFIEENITTFNYIVNFYTPEVEISLVLRDVMGQLFASMGGAFLGITTYKRSFLNKIILTFIGKLNNSVRHDEAEELIKSEGGWEKIYALLPKLLIVDES